MAKSRIRRDTVKVNNVSMFYRDTGSENPAILCLHGRWGRGETWVDLMARYKDRFRIIAPDQRGHGFSDKPDGPYTAEQLAADAHELMRLLGCVPMTVVGHSMGARVAGYIAALYPGAVRAVAILDETGTDEGLSADLSAEGVTEDDGLTSSWPTPYPSYEDAVKDLSSRFAQETNVRYFLESLVERLEGYDYLFSRRAMALIRESYRDWHDILRRIQCPVLLVRAEDSWCLKKDEAARMRADIKDCTYCEIGGSDHMVYADNPEEFYAAFEGFLNSIT
jgi:2-succinyl-6-hydroxy-2,4-cyclohexadiene-1-carboxylate synthase